MNQRPSDHRDSTHKPATTPMRVLITGGLGRIGHSLGVRFLERGYTVTTVDVRRVARTEEKLQAAARVGNSIWNSVIADLTPLDQLEEKVQSWIDHFGLFDVLINNAGCNAFGNVQELAVAQWQRVIDVNLTAPFVLSKTFARNIAARNVPSIPSAAAETSCIVNLSSTSGIVAEQNTSAYNTSKGGLILLTKSLAIDLAPLGIRVNAVAPGFIEVPADDPLYGREPRDVVETYRRHAPLQRGVTLEEIVSTVEFLVSPSASGITGEVVRIDAGQLAMAVPPLGLGQNMDNLRHERLPQ